MAAPGRLLPRLRSLAARGPAVRFASTHTIQSQSPPQPIVPSQKQAQPIGGFYQAMLDDPMPNAYAKAEEPATAAAPKQKEPAAKKGRKFTPSMPPSSMTAERPPAEAAEQEAPPPAPNPAPELTGAEKAAIVFGTALAGPQSRAAKLAEAARQRQYTVVAGVRIPPRPEEPDNCCMSGCVNCVWERFREDMEEWQSASAEAESRLKEQEETTKQSADKARHVHVSMDDDGGGSETNWVPQPPKVKVAKDLWDDKLYQDIPVGIREFMKTEKRLKAVHEREGTTGG